MQTAHHPDLIRAANRLIAWIADNAEVSEGDRATGEPTSVDLPVDLANRLMAFADEACGADAGWGVWIVDERRWCNAADGDGNGLLVYRTEAEAKASADHQSVMYDLGPCEARPFDLAEEVTRD